MKTELQTAIDQWFEHREAESIAVNTKRTERTVLRSLVTSTGNIYVENVSSRHIDSLMRKLAKTRSANTRRLDHGILDRFFRWCADTGLSQRYHNPMAGHRKPKKVLKEHRHLHVSQFPVLLDAARKPRDRVFIALTLYLFLRQSEVTVLRIRDVDLQAGAIMVWQEKTQQEDRMPLSTELATELRRWFRAYQEDTGQALRPDWYLVPAYTRSTFIGPGVQQEQKLAPTRPFLHPERMVQTALIDIGWLEASCKRVDGKSAASGQYEGCHTLRRSGARALFDRLINDSGTYDGAGRTVQAMLHHSTFATTETYLGITLDKERRDDMIRGKDLFPALSAPNVVRLQHERIESVANL